jgi:hypothetical protein
VYKIALPTYLVARNAYSNSGKVVLVYESVNEGSTYEAKTMSFFKDTARLCSLHAGKCKLR